MNNKVEDAVNLIVSQTDYSKEEALQKLNDWDGNYLYVIKEYLNPNFLKKNKKTPSSKNQTIMNEIRNFMDTANREYEERKKKEEKRKQYLMKIRQQFLNEKQKYPDCLFDPPNCFKCVENCENPLCPKEKDARELVNNN